MASDRRGKRTAWSCTVMVPGAGSYNARNWYDGGSVQMAKEDAAEVAYRTIPGKEGGGTVREGAGRKWGEALRQEEGDSKDKEEAAQS